MSEKEWTELAFKIFLVETCSGYTEETVSDNSRPITGELDGIEGYKRYRGQVGETHVQVPVENYEHWAG